MSANERKRRTVKVTVSNGDHWVTGINGTIPEVRAYFRIGRTTNMGYGGEDHMVKITRLDFMDAASKADLGKHRRRPVARKHRVRP